MQRRSTARIPTPGVEASPERLNFHSDRQSEFEPQTANQPK